MSVYFNELTLDAVPQQNLMLLREFRRVWAQFARASDGGIKRLIVNDQGMEGLSKAASAGADREMLQFIFSVFVKKFRDKPEDEFTEVANDHFNGAEYHIRLQTGDAVECQTMGWAALNRSVTLGLASTPFWRKLHYEIEEESLEDGMSALDALCITEAGQVADAGVQGWIVSQRKFEDIPEPMPCPIPPDKKFIKYQEHHGKELLREFAAKLVKHPYVQGVCDSIAFDSTTNRFILRCYPDGTVDIRMHWTEMGCGLKVQTVGKDYRQTEFIADILEEKFNRKS